MNDIRICKMFRRYITPAAAGTMANAWNNTFYLYVFNPDALCPTCVAAISSILVILIRILPSGRGIGRNKKDNTQ